MQLQDTTWNQPLPAGTSLSVEQTGPADETIQAWLIEKLAELLDVAADTLDVHETFERYGLASVDAVGLSGDLEDWLGRSLAPTLLYDYPTIATLARFLAHGREDVSQARAQGDGERALDEPVALVGMGCRFPGGVTSPEQFWQLLQDGRAAISEIPATRWESAAFYDPDPQATGKMYTRHGGFLPDLEQFDASFFGISPREAVRMEPQQRLLLEVAWEALEQAGLAPALLAGSRTGVFVGMMNNQEYFQLQMQQAEDGVINDPYLGLGSSSSVAAGRLAYFFDFQGPALTIDTACSSSLVALHLACQSLRNHECDLALVGGVNAILAPESMVNACKMNMLSRDGRCKTFDAAADGFGLGEGCGVVVLKRLSEAQAAGDTILTLVRGSAVNQDGRSNGLTAPNGLAQEAVVRQALAHAEVDPAQVGYVEAHGSGTALGDPIELEALAAVFGPTRQQHNPLLVGAVKTNLGHLAGAAGMAGLLKTVLALQHAQIPPHLNLSTPNPHVAWERLPVKVPACLEAWPAEYAHRIAGVSSFGWSGTNAHVVLEAGPPAEMVVSPREHHLLLLSAKSARALERMSDNLLHYLRTHPETPMAELAATLQAGRNGFAFRRLLICRDQEEALAILETRDPARLLSMTQKRAARPVAFLFPGLGEQYAGMAGQLYEQEPVFREIVDECLTFLATSLELDLRETLYPLDWQVASAQQNAGSRLDLRALLGRADAASSTSTPLQQTVHAQPLIFVIEYALARLLMHWGIRPGALLGYSLGEYVAACLAGVFSLEDALMLVATRARLIQEQPSGAMLAVALSEEDAQAYLNEQICLAAVNGPLTCVLTGPEEAIARVEIALRKQEIACRRVATTHALHSSMLETLSRPLTTLVQGMTLHAPRIPYLSNVTGSWITEKDATDPAYWARHMCQTVRFSDGVTHLLQEQQTLLLEVGPGQSLASFVRQHPACSSGRLEGIFSLFPASHEKQVEALHFTRTLGKLWLAGCAVDWVAFADYKCRTRLALPTYPFEHERYWIDLQNTPERSAGQRERRPASGKKAEIADWFYRPVWQEAPLSPLSTHATALRGNWLFFLDDLGVMEALARRLELDGQRVLRVRAGAQFTQTGADDFTLRPAHANDYLALCQLLQTTPDTIVHGWNIPSESAKQSELSGAESSFFNLLSLAQALGKHFYTRTLRLVVVSSALAAVEEQETVQPEKAPILGILRVLPQEQTNIVAYHLDIAPSEANEWTAGPLIEALRNECLIGLTEQAVAYRGATRRVQTYVPEHLEQVAHFRQQGVYLITGGLGEIGLALAEYLVQQAQARVVLLGRNALPERAGWDEWLRSHTPDDAIGRKIQRLQAMERAGGEILLQTADVADVDAMRRVIAQTRARFGTLHGVIQAAGVTSTQAFHALQDLHAEECALHFAPKVAGTLVLAEVVRDVPLDFCLLFSSISTVLGGLGFTAYAAANSFLDAFAQQQRRAGLPWLSVGWDAWLFAEGDASRFGQSVAAFAMRPEEALEAFRRVLAAGQPHLINSTGDLQARLRQWVRRTPARVVEIAADVSNEAAPLPAPGAYEQKIAEVWQQVLGLQQVGLYDNFFDLGGNSLIAMDMVTRLKRIFQVQIPAVALFEAPTVSALAKYLRPEPAPLQQTGTLVRRRVQARRQLAQEGIAIIGMAGRFPGASNLEQFWDNLRNGVESITFFSQEELLAAGVDPALLQQANFVGARPVLADIEHFDAAFFGYSPREAELMDPQHRLFLECAWEALECAGYDTQVYPGLVGVYAGANISTYLLAILNDLQSAGPLNNYQMVIGNDKDSLTTAVSYKLNLKGPSFAVQTFCSTSLVATHLACQSLALGECDLALAGGVSVRVPAKGGHLYEAGGMESPDGHCRTFDARAQGSIFGDGVGLVVLKRLSEALEDGDTIYAVVKGSAINNDGSLKVSYTAPSVAGQAEVVATALANAGVSAESISYVEAHGTATELGDPIEVSSLTKAYRGQTEQVGYCAIGSVKTNLGHLDRAAGVTGLIKTALALVHEEIPPNLHFETPNPEIDFAHSPFYVNTQLAPWKRGQQPRRAGVNSLGMGGTNAHVVLEEAPLRPASSSSRPWQLLLLSARTPTALASATTNLANYLRQHPESPLADVASTLQVGRRRFEYRSFLLARDHDEALAGLEQQASVTFYGQRVDRAVAFLLPGLGEQYPGMARDLYQRERVFREIVDHCCTFLEPLLNTDLREVLFPSEQETSNSGTGLDLRALLGRNGREGQQAPLSEAAARLRRTELAQPAVFVIEYALARLFMRWGAQPQAMLGYSLGEYVAACLSGVFSLEDALTLVAGRARLIGELAPGAMLVVALSEEALQPYLDEQVNLAIVNGPATCVLSGPVDALERVRRVLLEREIACRAVETTHAFHSALLLPLSETVTALAGRIPLHAPQIPYISNLSGTWITAQEATDPAYWARHMCQTVRFAAGVQTLLEQPETILLEIGPGQALGSFVRQHPACPQERWPFILASLPSAHERGNAQQAVLSTLGKLWLLGAAPDWSGFYADERRQRLPLPTYPFERQRYWIEPGTPARPATRPTNPRDALHALKKDALADWFYLPAWKQTAPALPFADRQLLAAPRCWLLFLDEQGVGQYLKARLEEQGQQVVLVTPGRAFARLHPAEYTVQPGARADYTVLLRDLQAQGQNPTRVIHGWLVDNPPAEHIHTTLERGCHSLIALAQAWHDLECEPAQISVLTTGLQEVTGQETLLPLKATVTGPCKVIPQEYPGLSCRSIDLLLPSAGSWQEEALLEQVLAEITGTADETVVALRGDQRWLQTFEAARLEPAAEALPRLRSQGVYLVTGGLGGIGLAMARYLAQTVQARLVLVGRTALPARATWPDLLADKRTEAVLAERIRQVLALEELGAQVLICAADVADEAQMRDVLEQTRTRFGALHGILHAAGVPGAGLIQLKTPEMLQTVLAPKIMGVQALEKALDGQRLDFLVLFSSTAALTGGGLGQVDYCAANAFLDAYARQQRTAHGLTVAIDWAEWQWNAWDAGLAGYQSAEQEFFRVSRQRFGIAFEEGAEALRRILSTRYPQVVVSTQNFPALLEISRQFNAALLQANSEKQQVREAHPRPVLGSSYVPPQNEMQRRIAGIWEEMLGVTPVGVQDNFFELGGNSLTGVDLITRLRKELAIHDLPAHILYEAPSVSALARYIEQGRSQSIVEDRVGRGEKRRAGLQQRAREGRKTR